MKHKKYGKQKVIACIIALGILLAGTAAQAKPYAAEGFAIEIPDGSNVYYYTPADTNMTDETMLKSAQGEPDVAFLTGVYTKDGTQGLLSLAYSLKIVVTPAPAETDGAQQAEARVAELMQQLSEGYTFGELGKDEVAGQAASMVSGESTAEAYSIRIYASVYGESMYTVTLIYKQAGDDQYLNGAVAQLNTLTFGTQVSMAPTPEGTQAAEQTSAPAVTPSVTASPQASETAAGTGSAVPLMPVEEDTSPPVIRFLSDNILLVCVGAGIIILITAIIILTLRLRRQKKRNIQAVTEMQSVPDAVPRKAIPWEEIHIAERIQKPNEQETPETIKTVAKEPQQETKEEGLWTQRVVEGALKQAYALKGKRDYIYAAKQFNDVLKHTNDVEIKKAAQLQVLKCLISAKQPQAALKKAQKALYKEYGYTVDERVKLKSIIQILKKQTGGNKK